MPAAPSPPPAAARAGGSPACRRRRARDFASPGTQTDCCCGRAAAPGATRAWDRSAARRRPAAEGLQALGLVEAEVGRTAGDGDVAAAAEEARYPHALGDVLAGMPVAEL